MSLWTCTVTSRRTRRVVDVVTDIPDGERIRVGLAMLRAQPSSRFALDWRREPEQQHCHVCGCTDDRACAGGCSWMTPDLCSGCAT